MHKGWGGYSSLHIQSFIQKPIRNYRQCNFSQSRCRLSGNFNIYLCICLGYKIKASDFFHSWNGVIVNFIIHQMFVLCDIDTNIFFMNVLKSWCFSLMNQKEPLVFLATIRPISKGLIRCPIKNEKCHRGEKYFSTFPKSFRLRNGKWSSAWPFLAFTGCQPVLPYILTKLFQTWTLQNEWMLFAFFSKLATLTWWQLLNKMDMSEYRCFGLQG